jgi:hypothetical protein
VTLPIVDDGKSETLNHLLFLTANSAVLIAELFCLLCVVLIFTVLLFLSRLKNRLELSRILDH